MLRAVSGLKQPVSGGIRAGDATGVPSPTTVHPAQAPPPLLRGFELTVHREPTSRGHTDPSQPPGSQVDSWGLGVSVSTKGLPQPVNTHTPMGVGPVPGDTQGASEERDGSQRCGQTKEIDLVSRCPETSRGGNCDLRGPGGAGEGLHRPCAVGEGHWTGAAVTGAGTRPRHTVSSKEGAGWPACALPPQRPVAVPS